MLFRWLLVVCSVLLLVIVAIAVAITPSFALSTNGQLANSPGQIADNQQALNCPDAPLTVQGLFLDFCSPSYTGNVGGPF